MRLTIHLFKNCLKNPEVHFRTLSNAAVVNDHSHNPEVWRTTNFAEAEIKIGAQRYYLCMPLSEEAHLTSLRKMAMLSRLNSPCITECQALIEEMIFANREGEICTADLLLHKLPEGDQLVDAVNNFPKGRLLKALDLVEGEFRRLGIIHNNLTPHNIIVGDNCEFIPIRYANLEYATQDHDCGEEFAILRGWIEANCQVTCSEYDYMAGQCCKLSESLFSGYKHVSNPFEERVCVADDDGYFYVTCQNEVVINTRFKWAGDFLEGRAEVETQDGMGLIDKEGNFVIPAKYNIVDYDANSGLSRVRQGEEWGLFNYIGEQILPFESRQIDDVDLEIFSI